MADEKHNPVGQPSVELREYIERTCKAHRMTINTLIEGLSQRATLIDQANREAVDKAYAELQRRLDILNHAHEQAVKDRSEFMRRDVINERMEGFDLRITGIQTEIDRAAGRNRTLIWLFGAGIAILQVAIGILALRGG